MIMEREPKDISIERWLIKLSANNDMTLIAGGCGLRIEYPIVTSRSEFRFTFEEGRGCRGGVRPPSVDRACNVREHRGTWSSGRGESGRGVDMPYDEVAKAIGAYNYSFWLSLDEFPAFCPPRC